MTCEYVKRTHGRVTDYDLPRAQIALHGGIPQNTEYNVVPNSFLDGLVNFCGIRRGFLLNRNGLDRYIHDSYEDCVTELNAMRCTRLLSFDDVVLYGETDHDYWIFWYDSYAPDGCITRLGKDLFRDLDELVELYTDYLRSIYANWRRSDDPEARFFEFKPRGWLTG